MPLPSSGGGAHLSRGEREVTPPCFEDSMDHALLFISGLDHFNARRYFEAHEVWEDLWRELRGERRSFVQAMIQFSVALHHYSRGNTRGARTLLERAEKRLAELPRDFSHIDIEAVREAMQEWAKAARDGAASPVAPVLGADLRMLESLFLEQP